jgi:hypothetical protein
MLRGPQTWVESVERREVCRVECKSSSLETAARESVETDRVRVRCMAALCSHKHSGMAAVGINPLNRSGCYILPTQCIYVFRMILTINSDYFPKQH